MSENQLQTLIDERNIIRLVTSVARAQDARDWVAYRACFDDSVVVEQPMDPDVSGTEFSGEQWTRRAASTIDGFDRTQHCLFNHTVTVDGDQAAVEVDLIARHELLEPSSRHEYTVGGRYHLRLRRKDSGWRIQSRRFEVGYETGDSSLMQQARDRVAAGDRPR